MQDLIESLERFVVAIVRDEGSPDIEDAVARSRARNDLREALADENLDHLK